MKRLTIHTRRYAAFLILSLSLVTASPAFGQNSVSAPGPVGQSVAVSDESKRQEAFKIVWETVNDLFFDPNFGGVNWLNMRGRYEPLAARAKSDEVLHELLQKMLNELHQSHFMIIPPDAIPRIRIKKAAKDSGTDNTDPEPDEFEDEDELLLDNFELAEQLSTGIGIDLRVMQGVAVITRVEPGSTGARAGLRPGFVIKAADDRLLATVIGEVQRNPLWGTLIRPQLPIILVARLINGEDASRVKLSYLDAHNRLRTVRVKREKLKGAMSSPIGNLPSMYTEVESKRLPGGIGYIRFNAFVPSLIEQLCGALRSMRDAPGIVLDLRGNQGGLLGMVGGLIGLLETKPTLIGTMQTRNGPSMLLAFPQQASYAGPVVILVDGSTQSAGELFASGLQESGRATVVGEQSAGKTLPSAIRKLPTGALFQYGFANYATPKGNSLEGLGVAPDLVVKLNRSSLLRGSDLQIDAAIKKLREEIELNALIRNPGPDVVVVRESPTKPTADKHVDEPPIPPPPAKSPPIMIGEPLMIERADDKVPSVESVLEKYIEASGGRGAFEKLTSRISKGTVELTAIGAKGTVEIYEENPNKLSVIIDAEGLGLMQRTFDGTRGWLQDPLQGYINFDGLGLEFARMSAVFNKQTKLKELYPGAIVLRKEKLDGAESYVLQLGYEKWFFDVASGLLLRKGNTYYDDYREVDGVNLPFKIREEAFSGVGVVYHLMEIKHNVLIDRTKFNSYPSCFTKS